MAKSSIMMAFFFTSPINMMVPAYEYTPRSLPKNAEREQRAECRERQTGKNREWVHEAFVENAEHHVNHEDRDEQQGEQSALCLREFAIIA